MRTAIRRISALVLCAGMVSATAIVAQAAQGVPQVPQIPAFLPMANTVPATSALPIDGEWMVTSIGKRVRVQTGRAYALDPWVHLFVLQIQPMMVVIKDIRETGSGAYAGSDLPLIGPWQAQLAADGTLNVSVQTALGPARYAMMPVRMDDQQAFDRARRGEASALPVADEPPREDEPDAPEEEDETPNEDEEDWDW